MKNLTPVFCYLLFSLFFIACTNEGELFLEPNNAVISFDGNKYRVNDSSEMEELLTLVLGNENISFSKIGYYAPGKVSHQSPSLVACHSSAEQHFTSVLPLDKKGEGGKQQTIFEIACVMQCVSNTYCTDCIQQVISECKKQQCTCEEAETCQSFIRFL